MQRKKKIKRKNEGEEGLPGVEGGRCVTGLSASLAVLRCCGSNGSSKRCYCLPLFRDVLPGSLLCFCFLRSLAVSSFPSSQCWVFGVSLLCFGCFSLLFSLFVFFLCSGSFSFPPFSLLCSSVLFIEPRGEAFYGCTWGAEAAAVGRPFECSCRGTASPFFW
jgi:hypothetical protein